MHPNLQNRRSFLKKLAFGSITALSFPGIVKTAALTDGNNRKKISISDSDVILFQGDSITDGKRDKENINYNDVSAMGTGFVMVTAAKLLFHRSSQNLKIYNRGISGNKVYQLAERWEEDCIQLKPDILTILIGVNDYWHTLKDDYSGTTNIYQRDYKQLLERTKQNLPDVKLIIGEPFAIPGIKIVDNSWYPEFDEYRAAAKEIAEQYGDIFIPFQSIFDEATKKASPTYWTHDGIHPSLPGLQLMATAWWDVID